VECDEWCRMASESCPSARRRTRCASASPASFRRPASCELRRRVGRTRAPRAELLGVTAVAERLVCVLKRSGTSAVPSHACEALPKLRTTGLGHHAAPIADSRQ
jgi:hypothetical protein